MGRLGPRSEGLIALGLSVCCIALAFSTYHTSGIRGLVLLSSPGAIARFLASRTQRSVTQLPDLPDPNPPPKPWPYPWAKGAKHRTQGLTMRQDRNGETASLTKSHGDCQHNRLVWWPDDDCAPVDAAIQHGTKKWQEYLDDAPKRTLGGVHWTSGDTDPRIDAFPLREQAGGYSAWSDISYDASEGVHPTMYKPVFTADPRERALGTKHTGRKPSLKVDEDAAEEGEEGNPDAADGNSIMSSVNAILKAEKELKKLAEGLQETEQKRLSKVEKQSAEVKSELSKGKVKSLKIKQIQMLRKTNADPFMNRNAPWGYQDPFADYNPPADNSAQEHVDFFYHVPS